MGIIDGAIDIAKKGIGIGSKAVVDQSEKMKYVNDLIKAEANSTNKWIQLARPSIIFLGVVVIAFEILGIRIGILLFFDASIEVIRNSTAMLEFFIVVWSGIVGTYVYKRPEEKHAAKVLLMNRIQASHEAKVESKFVNKMNNETVKHTRRSNRRKRKQRQ
tara:strand:- start:71 stop:553 length:483 start_codon:yes stop_codon:yes gene_type:complete